MQKVFRNQSNLIHRKTSGTHTANTSDKKNPENYLYNNKSDDYNIEDSLQSFMIINDITEMEESPISKTDQSSSIFAQLSMSFYDRKALSPNSRPKL